MLYMHIFLKNGLEKMCIQIQFIKVKNQKLKQIITKIKYFYTHQILSIKFYTFPISFNRNQQFLNTEFIQETDQQHFKRKINQLMTKRYHNQESSKLTIPIQQEYQLRKSPPFGSISSILKVSNKIQTKKTLADISQEYDKSVNSKVPLIKKIQQANSNAILFSNKKQRNTVNLTQKSRQKSFCHQKSSLNYSSYKNNKQNEEQKCQYFNKNLADSYKFNSSRPFQRCRSSKQFFIKPLNSPLIKNYNHKNLAQTTQIQKKENKNNHLFYTKDLSSNKNIDKIFLSITETIRNHQTQSNCSINRNNKTPSFLNKTPKNEQKISKNDSKISNIQYLKSRMSTLPQSNNLQISKKRTSVFIPTKKVLSIQRRLCINCYIYVNKNQIAEHQQKCLGFKIILKMSNRELIDFLNDKIDNKLKQLKSIEEQQIELNQITFQNQGYLRKIQLIRNKKKCDNVINDLDGVRLKALKRFHVADRLPTQ